ncbi:phytanoyl-CoA dioxygenase family protein [Terasakiella sp. SH-1]|uniref:phytanoyl-CoA dioxygenase family protein n=1 Tax=Terasakiella sp. SH-1 TaxID=2560057 RepID=UPI0010738E41|nr:phytanoyl-CoA dioxygenase family protein [Terasakiella sp. SH-1]
MLKLTNKEIVQHVQNLEILGYTVLENYLPDNVVLKMRKKLEQQRALNKDRHYPGYSELRSKDEQVFNLQNKDVDFLRLLSDSNIENILMKRINDEYYPALEDNHPNYILGEFIARKSGDPLRLHIDSWMPSTGNHCWMMQVVFALHDRNEEDGCTTLVPGSHRIGDYTDREFPNVVKVPIKAGDVVMWDSRLWHGALANISDQDKWVLIATIQRWWVKQRFDIPNAIPKNILKKLTDREKILLGFASRPPLTEFDGTNARGGYEAL